jgi:hypothetical protein
VPDGDLGNPPELSVVVGSDGFDHRSGRAMESKRRVGEKGTLRLASFKLTVKLSLSAMTEAHVLVSLNPRGC